MRIRYVDSLPLGFGAMTIFPFGTFIVRRWYNNLDLLRHEAVHWEQQRKWYKKAWYFGLLAWYFLYLGCLPVKWNPWRWKWEYEAYKHGHKWNDARIRLMLSEKYYLDPDLH